MRHIVVVGLMSLVCAGTRASDVLAVLPTSGTGDVSAQAALVSTVMLGALQDASLAVASSEEVQRAFLDAGAAACSKPVACARVVGPMVHATKVVVAELWALAPGYQLRVAVVDVRSPLGPAAEDWLSFSAADKAALTQVAEQAVLAALKLERTGSLAIAMSEKGAEVLVDGIAMGPTPLLTPLKLKAGRHEVEVRYAQRVPWRGYVDVENAELRELHLCPAADAVVECAPETAATPSPLFIGGLVGAGLGVAGVVTGLVGLFAKNSAFEDYRNRGESGSRNSIGIFQTIAVVGLGGGGVLLFSGGAAAAASIIIE